MSQRHEANPTPADIRREVVRALGPLIYSPARTHSAPIIYSSSGGLMPEHASPSVTAPSPDQPGPRN